MTVYGFGGRNANLAIVQRFLAISFIQPQPLFARILFSASKVSIISEQWWCVAIASERRTSSSLAASNLDWDVVIFSISASSPFSIRRSRSLSHDQRRERTCLHFSEASCFCVTKMLSLSPLCSLMYYFFRPPPPPSGHSAWQPILSMQFVICDSVASAMLSSSCHEVIRMAEATASQTMRAWKSVLALPTLYFDSRISMRSMCPEWAATWSAVKFSTVVHVFTSNFRLVVEEFMSFPFPLLMADSMVSMLALLL